MRLKGKVAIITGSSRGIGRCIAETFAGEGAHVVINGRKGTQKQLEVLAQEIGNDAIKTLAVKGDVGEAKTVRRLMEQTLNKFGTVDILVNNAGVSPMAAIEQITEEQWDEVFTINMKSAFLCSQAVFPYMRKQRSGVILNISSGSAKSGGIGAHYAASKAAMNTFTKSLAFEGAGYGIRANSICPGPIETNMSQSLFSEERKRFLESVIPLGRLGTPLDIAHAAVFLCCGEASYISGEILDLDGGLIFLKPLSYPT